MSLKFQSLVASGKPQIANQGIILQNFFNVENSCKGLKNIGELCWNILSLNTSISHFLGWQIIGK